MIRIRQGTVVRIITESKTLQEIVVLVDGEEARAVNYPPLTGFVEAGNLVMLNTTALYKSLGTGGQHFVLANLALSNKDIDDPGHIMKLRYTPGQVKCLSVEEEDSPFHEIMKNTRTIDGLPVIVSTLHSMLPLILAGIRVVSPKLKVAFVMTDGAALPLWFSRLVASMKSRGWLDKTITIGHAFGGDLEAVNIYTGLLAARAVARADLAVVGMGPGIVGTGTPLGFTGVEQGEIINAVNILGGRAIAVPRISFADPRPRHRGLSHHSLTALGQIALTRAKVVLPRMDKDKMEIVAEQLNERNIADKHEIIVEDGKPALDIIRDGGMKVTTMGRNIDQDPEFFLTCGAAGIAAAKLLEFAFD